jgi:hypothetical protein
MLCDELSAALRFFPRLPSFLRRPITPEEALATLRRRREHRAAGFLELARRAIYEQPTSPYRELLRIAGCEYDDLVRLVDGNGVEGALRQLYRRGVFLTVDEFKGRSPVVRGSQTVTLTPALLRNPLASAHFKARSSGSRGTGGTAVAFDLAFARTCGVDTGLSLEARGGADWLKADWEIPGVGGTFRLLELSSFGAPLARWFSPMDPRTTARYRWNASALRCTALLAGARLPPLQYAPLDAPLVIARWMADTIRAGRTPYLNTAVSLAVRLCQAAFEEGIDLSGAKLQIAGEPITAARLAVIHRSGADAQPRYGAIELGPIGYGCLAPAAPDDIHFFDDLHALIQAGPDGEVQGHPPRALLMSSLWPTMPFITLNVSMGDQATVETRSCGCAMERLEWTTHLQEIRSYEKLTCQGMNFLDTDVIRVLEEVLPQRFGGAPTHYQLLEEEAEDGRSVLRLLVHPVVGEVDLEAVEAAFLKGLAHGAEGKQMAGVWREARLLRVERREPLATVSGKILHVHVKKR